MVVADELQGRGNGFDQIFLLDDGHDVRALKNETVCEIKDAIFKMRDT
jgi:hypothetical protein